jgi:hypothetical protein
MISYHAFGLRISASAAIPMLSPVESDVQNEPDVTVWLQSRPELEGEGLVTFPPAGSSPARPGRIVTWYPKPNYTRVHYPDGTEFYIDGENRTIWANWSDPWTADDMSTYLLGPILGYVLRRLGRVALHASSIATGHHACAFLGSAGAGKSTTAAAFAQKNIRVLADDVTALEERQSTFWVLPSYGHLRLWPESSEMLFGSREALPLITPNWNKRDVDLQSDDRFCGDPMRLSVIYWLAPRTGDPRAPYIERLDSVEQMMRLVENSYGNVLLDRELRTKEFITLGRLLKAAEVRKLVPHISPERLSSMLDLVLDDSASITT